MIANWKHYLLHRSDHLRAMSLSIIFIIFVLGFLIFGIWTWQRTRNDMIGRMQVETEFISASANRQYTQLLTGLRYISKQFDVASDHTSASDYIAISGFVESHPYIENVVLLTPAAEILLNTAESFAESQIFSREVSDDAMGIIQSLGEHGLLIGRTQRSQHFPGWHMTARYIARAPNGTPRVVIQADLPVDQLTGEWSSLHLPKGTQVGLLRTDGYNLALTPITTRLRVAYARKQMHTPLLDTLAAEPNTIEGVFNTSPIDNFLNDVGRLGVFVRLSHNMPVVAYIDIPNTRVWLEWWRHFMPVLLVALLGLSISAFLVVRLIASERRYASIISAERDQHAWKATHDSLTQLPNRAGLDTHLETALARAELQQKLLAVCMFDLDDFKHINDRFGHSAGDGALQHVADLINKSIRSSDFLARLGGDEFVIVLHDAGSIPEITHVLERIQHHLETMPYEIDETTSINLHGSLGVTVFPRDKNNSRTLLKHADEALYLSKNNKRLREHIWLFYK